MSNPSKDNGDLCRLFFWGKRCLDQLHALYTALDEISVLLFQAVGSKCHVYKMRAVGDICIGFRFATLHVPFGMDDLKSFEDQIDDWLHVEKAFLEFLNILSSAVPRTGAPPPAFSGLHTPSSKHM